MTLDQQEGKGVINLELQYGFNEAEISNESNIIDVYGTLAGACHGI